MPMTDAQATLSDLQNLAQVAGSYLSDKSYDFGEVGADGEGRSPIYDPGRGQDIALVVQVTETFASAGAATVTAELVMADDEALTSNLTVLRSSGAIDKALLTAGYQFRIGGVIPVGISQRYLGMRYTIGVATTTAGRVSAWLAEHAQSNPTV